jgi:hypothetical protein
MAETLGVILAASGVGLVYAALTNQNPVSELRAALRTGDTSGRTPINSGSSAGGTAGQTSTGGPASGLVTIRNGLQLEATAAAAFAAWERAFGAQIPLTGAARSRADQEAGYAADPDRFAAPGTSAHEEGRAVDVNLGTLGITVYGRQPAAWLTNAKYLALVKAAAATGWCNYQIKNNSPGDKDAEPWHFSYGVCK